MNANRTTTGRRSPGRGPLLAAAGLALAAAGCARGKGAGDLLDYTRSAEALFEEAMEEFDDEDCVEADKIFLEVRRKFPYSRFAPLAELRTADCQFIQGNNAEATVSYQQFVKAHPTHEEAHYAAFRRGLAFYEMIPGDWIITPPPHERDQAATRDARTALFHFLRTYPRSEHVERATELLDEVEDALVRHEMYVAEFYLSRDQQNAAAVRLEAVRESFPEASLVPDAMFLQAVTYLAMDRLGEAERVFGEIIEHYPDHHQARRAEDYLAHLARRGGSEGGAPDGDGAHKENRGEDG